MLKKLTLIITVFLILLIALTFGETILHEALRWVSYLTGLAIHNFSDLYHMAYAYIQREHIKILIALVLTLPVSAWILRRREGDLEQRYSPRKIAIVLAIFLGWLGAHRFYQGQIGLGIVYLIASYIFTPLIVAISLIDAARYLFMNDEAFNTPTLR